MLHSTYPRQATERARPRRNHRVASFHRFPDLPNELQHHIWVCALEQAHAKRRVRVMDFNRGLGNGLLFHVGIDPQDSLACKTARPSSLVYRPWSTINAGTDKWLWASPTICGRVSNIVLSCQAAYHCFSLRRRKQLLLFPGLGPTGPDVRLYEFLSAVDLEFDRFQIHYKSDRSGPYIAWYENHRPCRSVTPPLFRHLRHVEIEFVEVEFMDVLMHATIRRAGQSTRYQKCATVRTAVLGPFAHPEAKLESFAVTLKVRGKLSLQSVLDEVENVLAFMGLVDNHSFAWMRYQVDWLIIQSRLPPGFDEQAIWTPEEKFEWLAEIRSFWTHVSLRQCAMPYVYINSAGLWPRR